MPYFMEHNRTMEKLRAGGFALGLQLRSRSPLIAELAGYLGFDYLYIETEHFACSDETIESLARAAQISGVTPIVRTIHSDPENIGHLFDIGVQGVILPHVETPDQARSFVDAAKFPPLGHRGSSASSRAANLGCVDAEEYMEAANRNCLAIAMIETVKAVENLEAILDSGLDMIRVGFSDLSLDMGLLGKQKDPRFLETLRYITGEAARRGIPVGGKASSAESALQYKALGFRCLNVASDLDHLKNTLSPLLRSVREALEG